MNELAGSKTYPVRVISIGCRLSPPRPTFQCIVISYSIVPQQIFALHCSWFTIYFITFNNVWILLVLYNHSPVIFINKFSKSPIYWWHRLNPDSEILLSSDAMRIKSYVYFQFWQLIVTSISNLSTIFHKYITINIYYKV